MRSLASRTQQSTKEIQQMIGQLQSGTAQAVEAMETGLQKFHTSAKQAGKFLSVISRSVTTINDMSTYIATAAEEQTTSEKLNRQYLDLQGLVEQFKL